MADCVTLARDRSNSQRHIGIVADVAEILGHDVPGQHLLIATHLHRDSYILAGVKDLEAHQVIVDLEGGVKHLPVQKVMLRGGTRPPDARPNGSQEKSCPG